MATLCLVAYQLQIHSVCRGFKIVLRVLFIASTNARALRRYCASFIGCQSSSESTSRSYCMCTIVYRIMHLHIFKILFIFLSLVGMTLDHPMIFYGLMYPSPKELWEKVLSLLLVPSYGMAFPKKSARLKMSNFLKNS